MVSKMVSKMGNSGQAIIENKGLTAPDADFGAGGGI
jgi:hypothetical protein